MTYRIVFDLTQSGYRSWWFPAFGLLFVAIGVVLIVLSHRGVIDRSSPWKAVSPYLFFGFALLWSAGAFASTFGEYRRLRHAIETGQAQVVEGVVTNFVPMPYEGHASESFSVDGRRFAYSDYVVTAGFNNTSSHGGPIRAGLHVRITFVDATIVRLEIPQ